MNWMVTPLLLPKEGQLSPTDPPLFSPNTPPYSPTSRPHLTRKKKDCFKKNCILNIVFNMPCIKSKAEWAMAWSCPQQANFLSNLCMAWAAIEGIFFSESFCVMYWLKKHGLMTSLCMLCQPMNSLATTMACTVILLASFTANWCAMPYCIQQIIMGAVIVEHELYIMHCA